jgi:hypothetical protein
MLSLTFEGWLECRLATDPDPCDEPRGVSGWTFAVAGEPDLDRLIRLQPEAAVGRVCGPRIGVTVRAVSLFGDELPDHPLQGARVELLDDPVFEGRNGIAAEDAQEPIYPFHLRVRAEQVLLRREHRDPATGAFFLDPPVAEAVDPAEVAAVIGDAEPAEFRSRRRGCLERVLEGERDEVRRVALKKRIVEIERAVGTIAELSLRFALPYRIVMQGPWVEIRDPQDVLGGAVDSSPWTASFWIGAFDADALAAYTKGTVELPFRPASGS